MYTFSDDHDSCCQCCKCCYADTNAGYQRKALLYFLVAIQVFVTFRYILIVQIFQILVCFWCLFITDGGGVFVTLCILIGSGIICACCCLIIRSIARSTIAGSACGICALRITVSSGCACCVTAIGIGSCATGCTCSSTGSTTCCSCCTSRYGNCLPGCLLYTSDAADE